MTKRTAKRSSNLRAAEASSSLCLSQPLQGKPYSRTQFRFSLQFIRARAAVAAAAAHSAYHAGFGTTAVTGAAIIIVVALATGGTPLEDGSGVAARAASHHTSPLPRHHIFLGSSLWTFRRIECKGVEGA